MDLLKVIAVLEAIAGAWQESEPDDSANRHEEGGYIVENPDLTYTIERWPRGDRSQIAPPSFQSNRTHPDRRLIAAFHTHPNPPIDDDGAEYQQGPSTSDLRWHAARRLRGFVVSREYIYEIELSGKINVIGKRDEVIGS